MNNNNYSVWFCCFKIGNSAKRGLPGFPKTNFQALTKTLSFCHIKP